MTSSTKQSAHKKNEFVLSRRLCLYLEQKYEISSNFINAEEFLKDNNFFLKRYFNRIDYSTIFKSDKQSTFKFKLIQPRQKTYQINKNLEIFQPPKDDKKLIFEFTIDHKKNN